MTPEPITLAGVEVEDAFADWNLHCANSADLWAILDGEIEQMDVLSSHDVWVSIGNDRWAIFDYGIYIGFEKGESFENRATHSVETPNYIVEDDESIVEPDDDTVTGTFMYTHTLRSALESMDGVAPTMELRTRERYNSSRVVSMRVVQRIVNRYINGPLGTDYTSYTWYQKEGPGRHSSCWRRFVGDREDYLGEDYERSSWGSITDRGTENYVDCDVRLVEDDIAGFVPEPAWEEDNDE